MTKHEQKVIDDQKRLAAGESALKVSGADKPYRNLDEVFADKRDDPYGEAEQARFDAEQGSEPAD